MTVDSDNLTAEDYDYLLPNHWLARSDSIWTMMHHAYVNRVIEIIKADGAKTVVEVGCGDGWNCGQLVEAGVKTVVGCDWSANGINHARRMVPGATFHCGDVTDDEFMRQFSEPFDACLFVEVLEHIPPEDCVSALRNIMHFIRPGGVFVLTTPSVNFPNINDKHYRHFTEAILTDLIAETGGLTIEAIEGYGDAPYQKLHYRVRRLFQNRLFTIHPLVRWWQRRYASHALHTPLDRCAGFILTMRRIRDVCV